MEKRGFAKQVPEQVIKLAQHGDRQAFETIYRTYVDACYSLAYRICGDPKMAEDVVQNSFIKVIKKIKQFNHQGAFAGWLRRIVSNETISRIRANARLQLVDEEYLENRESVDSISGQSSEAQLPLAGYDLEKILQSLPLKSRAVLLLHEVEGYNHQEIADMFGMSESFSKVTLSRAFKKLKQLVLTQSGGLKNASK